MLMFSLPAENWYRLLAWLVIGMFIYFGYGRKHSVMSRLAQAGTTAPTTATLGVESKER